MSISGGLIGRGIWRGPPTSAHDQVTLSRFGLVGTGGNPGFLRDEKPPPNHQSTNPKPGKLIHRWPFRSAKLKPDSTRNKFGFAHLPAPAACRNKTGHQGSWHSYSFRWLGFPPTTGHHQACRVHGSARFRQDKVSHPQARAVGFRTC